MLNDRLCFPDLAKALFSSIACDDGAIADIEVNRPHCETTSLGSNFDRFVD